MEYSISAAVNYGDIGYFPSKNYRIPSEQQEESGGIVPSQVSYVTLTVISSYSHFETSQNGKNITQLKTGVPLTFYGMQTINFTYVPSGNSSDTGGLLRYDVIDPNVYTPPPETTTRVSEQLFTFLPAIIIGVPSMNFISLTFNLFQTDQRDSFSVSDDTGTYFNQPNSNLPLYVIKTGANVYIQVSTNYTGKFSFSWVYGNVSLPVTNQTVTLPTEQAFLLDLSAMSSNSSAVITHNSGIAIFGSVNEASFTFGDYSSLKLQSVLIYGEQGSGMDFLGSLYTLYTQKKPIIYIGAPVTITVFSQLNDIDAGLLFRDQLPLIDLDYDFYWFGANQTTLTYDFKASKDNKTKVVTIANQASQQWFWLNSLRSHEHEASMDWLPGSFLPPTAPILSFSDIYSTFKQIVPGMMNTFVTNNTVTAMFNSTGPPESSATLGSHMYGNLPSQNYRVATVNQQEYAIAPGGEDIRTIMKITVKEAYNYFVVSTTYPTYPGGLEGDKLTLGEQTLDRCCTGEFYIIYIPSNSSLDTGGFLTYDITFKSATNHYLLFSPIIVVLVNLFV